MPDEIPKDSWFHQKPRKKRKVIVTDSKGTREVES